VNDKVNKKVGEPYNVAIFGYACVCSVLKPLM